MISRLKSWEGLLLAVFVVIFSTNVFLEPKFLTVGNQINLFELSIEKIIVALIMTLVIINGEIDLSVSAIMGLAACAFGWMVQQGVDAVWAAIASLAAGVACGAFNGWFITKIGLPSLVVTLSTLIGFRGLARVLVEDRGINHFPDWVNRLGQQSFVGPIPFAMVVFFALFVLLYFVLERSGFGRKTYVIGANRDVAEFSGIDAARHKLILFTASGFVSALAGLLYAARVGAVRGDIAQGFELDIITIVLLGGVSIFGGSGTLIGTLLSILIVLNLRNGMGLLNVTGHVQTAVVGVLLLLSVVAPRIRMGRARGARKEAGP